MSLVETTAATPMADSHRPGDSLTHALLDDLIDAALSADTGVFDAITSEEATAVLEEHRQ